MDTLRVWLARVVAPLAFLAAAGALVVLVDRGLDGGSDASTVTAAEPVSSVPLTTEPVESGTTEPAEEQFYRVKAGDTLEAIAARFSTTVDALLELNPGVDPLALSPGQRLRVG
jgi:LysM repeat protein